MSPKRRTKGASGEANGSSYSRAHGSASGDGTEGSSSGGGDGSTGQSGLSRFGALPDLLCLRTATTPSLACIVHHDDVRRVVYQNQSGRNSSETISQTKKINNIV